VPALNQQFENAARDFEFSLSRLVGVCVDADRNRRRPVGARGQFIPE